MTAIPKTQTIYTAEEYLELERAAESRSEFVDGEIYRMAGESLSHSRICVNISREVSSALLGKPCEALSSNMKVRTSTASLFAYPDLTIVCGAPEFHDRKKDVVINPRAIFEVLSPSTEKYDRGKKFQRYRLGNPTLTDYVLIAQDAVLLEHFRRAAGGVWNYENYSEPTDVFRLAELGLELSLEKIYDRVELTAAEDGDFKTADEILE